MKRVPSLLMGGRQSRASLLHQLERPLVSPSAPFEIISLGVGNFFSVHRYCTSFLLRAGTAMVLVDCPDPLFHMFHNAGKKLKIKLDPARIDDVILTHLHGDHSNGLESFGFWKKFLIGHKTRPRIHTSRDVARVLWTKLSPAMEEAHIPMLGLDERYELSDFFDVRAREFGETFTVKGIKIETRQTQHSVPTFGFRATFAGRRFGYSCDTTYDEELIDFLEPCDLIFHECDKGFHTSLEQLEKLPAALRKKMRLVHLNDEFPGSRKLQPAKEGAIYRV